MEPLSQATRQIMWNVSPAWLMYLLFVVEIGFLGFIASVLGLVGLMAVLYYAYTASRDRRTLSRDEKSEILREWPGLLRVMVVRFSKCDPWIRSRMDKNGVKYERFDITLTGMAGEPKGRVFVIERSGLRLAMWEHWGRTSITFLHLCPYRGIGRDQATMLINELDLHLA